MSTSNVKLYKNSDQYHFDAVVLSVEGDSVMVRTHQDTMQVSVAVSCILKPEVADKVMCYQSESGSAYILHVLERQEGQGNSLLLNGDTSLKVSGGSFVVDAEESLSMVAGSELNNLSRDYSLISENASVYSRQLDVQGDKASVKLGVLASVVSRIETVADSLIQTLKRNIRVVKDHEQVKAGNLVTEVEKVSISRAGQAFITSKGDLKVDAKRIHMG